MNHKWKINEMIDHDTQMELDMTDNETQMDFKEYIHAETCTESKFFEDQQAQTDTFETLNQET